MQPWVLAHGLAQRLKQVQWQQAFELQRPQASALGLCHALLREPAARPALLPCKPGPLQVCDSHLLAAPEDVLAGRTAVDGLRKPVRG